VSVVFAASRLDLLRGNLSSIERDFARPVFTTSFGAEDMVLLEQIARYHRGIAVATLDTGRLPTETYDLWQRVTEHYRLKIEVFFPRAERVESYVQIHGINGFYDSVAQRRECCHVRKVEPLMRLLDGRDAWITGLRRGQSVARSTLMARETDTASGVEKFNPLLDWSEDDVWAYLREHRTPVHALHERGYPSIGCAPCTRAVEPGQDLRSGRWWWENDAQKECGLHIASERSE
jgi:phosphoadenosine phosphosulfate reductase